MTIEAGGIMVGGTALEVAAHTKETWRRGQEAVGMVREEHIAMGGVALAGRLVPVHGGGVRIHKIRSAMSDAVISPPPFLFLCLSPCYSPCCFPPSPPHPLPLAVRHRHKITKGNWHRP